ncbi:hypothetical protein [Roseibium alexandrii]|uniref:hypothetical protein n=1 Tax=Roseibium alexandrii TaxID=388408 RepID=UPI003752546B
MVDSISHQQGNARTIALMAAPIIAALRPTLSAMYPQTGTNKAMMTRFTVVMSSASADVKPGSLPM